LTWLPLPGSSSPPASAPGWARHAQGAHPWGKGTILDHQLSHLQETGVKDVVIVVGFQGERIAQHLKGAPRHRWPRTPASWTPTPRSRCSSACRPPCGGVVTLNGDVVFDAGILPLLLDRPDTTASPSIRACAATRIKYRVRDGRLQGLSKQVHGERQRWASTTSPPATAPPRHRPRLHGGPGLLRARRRVHPPFTATPCAASPSASRRAIEIDFQRT